MGILGINWDVLTDEELAFKKRYAAAKAAKYPRGRMLENELRQENPRYFAEAEETYEKDLLDLMWDEHPERNRKPRKWSIIED